MADIFQPSLTPTRGGENFVQKGVADNSTAKAIQGFGKMGTELLKGSVLADLEGADDNKDFVDPTSPEFASLSADDILSDLNLTNISAARKQGKLTGAGAAALVNSKAKALITAHPYFSQEIKSATSQFFSGIGLGGSGGTGGGGGFFTDKAPEKTLLDKTIEAGAKGGWVDPTLSRGAQVRQVKGHHDRSLALQRLNLASASSAVSERRKTIETKKLSEDYFAGDSISVEKELKDIVTEFKDLPRDQLLERLERFRIDKDNEARQSMEVSRIGESSFQAQFQASIGAKIELEESLAKGTLTQSVYETQNANLRAMGENRVLQIQGVPELAAVATILRNLPVGLIPGETSIEFQSLASKLVGTIPTLNAVKSGVSMEDAPQASLPMPASNESKLFYGMLKESLGQTQVADASGADAINKEIGVMLSADSDGTGRYGDTFDQKRWDTALDFWSSPDMLEYMKGPGKSLPPEALAGLDNAVQTRYIGSLMRATKAQMETTLDSQLDKSSASGFIRRRGTESPQKPFSNFVTINTDGGELRFTLKPGSGFEALGDFEKRTLARRIEKLNTNYANRVNKMVRSVSHIRGTNNYSKALDTILFDHGLISEGTGSDS